MVARNASPQRPGKGCGRMQMREVIRRRSAWVLVVVLAVLAACSGKRRPFGKGIAGSSGEVDDVGPDATAQSGGSVPRSDELSTKPVAVGDTQSADVIACGVDECLPADAGVSSSCVPTGPRDCSSDLDNDCDGQPDNVVDEICVCALGTSEPCDEHPGLDGNGACRGGLRTCVLAADGRTPEWGACEGSVGPGGADSCIVRGDDADCDGTPNSDCPCVDGDSQPCGSSTDVAGCAIGASTCVNARFGACVGAVPPAPQDSCVPGDDSNCNGRANDRFCACLDGNTQECGVTDTGACQLGARTCVNGSFGQCVDASGPFPRDCRSAQDNDCDGRPDNTIDNVCQCIPGQGNGPCNDDPNNPRCNGQGRCVPCQTNEDCSLVAGDLKICDNSKCVPDVLVIGDRIEPSILAVTSNNVFALSMAGVIRLAKDGSSPAGGDLIAPGRFALSGFAGLITSGDLAFWNTGTSLVRLGTDGVQSTVAAVGISGNLAPIAAGTDNIYWVEELYGDRTYLRSSATASTLTAPRTVLRTVTLGAGTSVPAIAGIGDCIFAVVDRDGSYRIDRACATEEQRGVHPAQGQLGALAVDNSGLYFIEEGVGLRRLAPLDSASPGTVTLAAGASSVVPTADFIYFVQNGRSPAGTCGVNSSIQRLAKTGGAAQVVEAGPLSCPVSLAVDSRFVYWSDTAGFVKRSGKDAQ